MGVSISELAAQLVGDGMLDLKMLRRVLHMFAAHLFVGKYDRLCWE